MTFFLPLIIVLCQSLHYPEPRIVNGIPSVTSYWPWIVSIRLQNSRNNQHICGGSVIRLSAPAAILTAAHCMDWFDTLKGSYNIWIDINRDDITDADQVYDSYKMSKYVYHPNISYDPTEQTGINDVGIIFIDSELPSTHSIIELNADNEWIGQGDMYNVVGYGWDDYDTKEATETLEHTILTFVSDTQCNTAFDAYFDRAWTVQNYTLFLQGFGIEYGNAEDMPYDILQCHECVLCAIGNDSDSCNGDSGSPLVKINEDINGTVQYVQVGIVSFGFECNVKGNPGVYTDVSYYYEWIENELKKSLENTDGARGAFEIRISLFLVSLTYFL